MCLPDESLVLQDKCNIEIFLSPEQLCKATSYWEILEIGRFCFHIYDANGLATWKQACFNLIFFRQMSHDM